MASNIPVRVFNPKRTELPSGTGLLSPSAKNTHNAVVGSSWTGTVIIPSLARRMRTTGCSVTTWCATQWPVGASRLWQPSKPSSHSHSKILGVVSRPADVDISQGSHKVFVDACVTSPFQRQPGSRDALRAATERKLSGTVSVVTPTGVRDMRIAVAASDQGMKYCPFTLSALGRWHPKAQDFVRDTSAALHYQFPDNAHDVHDQVGDFNVAIRNAVNKSVLEMLPSMLYATGQYLKTGPIRASCWRNYPRPTAAVARGRNMAVQGVIVERLGWRG